MSAKDIDCDLAFNLRFTEEIFCNFLFDAWLIGRKFCRFIPDNDCQSKKKTKKLFAGSNVLLEMCLARRTLYINYIGDKVLYIHKRDAGEVINQRMCWI